MAQTSTVPFLDSAEIWEQADAFLDQYWPSRKLPVDILNIAEFDLHLDFRTIRDLKQDSDIDALLLKDRTTILVDHWQFMETQRPNRLRFSVAHEIGHLVLHCDIIEQFMCDSVKEWVAEIQGRRDSDYYRLEWQADEFAGRILVPYEILCDAFARSMALADSQGISTCGAPGEMIIQYVSEFIARRFEVSGQAIQCRLRREGLWPP